MSFALMFPAVSLHKSADYKRVPAEFDGNPHYGETTPTSLRKEVLRSDERHRQPTPGAEPSQSKTAHRCGHTTEHPRLVGPVRQPQGLHARQSANTHPDTGRHYHYQPKNKDSGQPLELDLTTVHKHLAGWVTIGLYAINPQSQRCKWIAICADYDDAFFDLGKLKGELELDGVSPAGDVPPWRTPLDLCEQPLLAEQCRVYVYNVALRLGVPIKGAAGLREGIEILI